MNVVLRTHACRFGQFRYPEVQNLHPRLGRDHDVAGLNITMDDSGRVRRCQPARDLCTVVGKFAEWQTVGRYQLCQSFARHEF